MVAKHERGHRLDYWDRARQNTRIVASASRELRLFTRYVYGFLFVRDRRCRLKSDAKVNLFAVADPALYAAGIICRRPEFTSAHFKWVVVLGATHVRRRKSGTDLKSFGCRKTQHRFRQISLELIKHRLAKSGRNAPDDAFNHATHRITFIANLPDQRLHSLRRRNIRASDRILLCVLHLNARTIDLRDDVVNLRDVTDDLEIRVQDCQYLFRDCAGGDAGNRLTRRRATAALPVTDSIFRLITKIGMRRPKFSCDLHVVLRPGVLVAHEDRDRRAERFATENAGDNFAPVFLLSLRRDFALTRTTTIQLTLDVRWRDFDFWRTTVNYDTNPAAVRFTKRRDAKKLAKSISHCVTQSSWLLRNMKQADAYATLNRLEGYLQIVDQIAHVLDANRNTHQRISDAERFALLLWHRRMRHERGMIDQAFDAAQTLREREEVRVLEEPTRTG